MSRFPPIPRNAPTPTSRPRAPRGRNVTFLCIRPPQLPQQQKPTPQRAVRGHRQPTPQPQRKAEPLQVSKAEAERLADAGKTVEWRGDVLTGYYPEVDWDSAPTDWP